MNKEELIKHKLNEFFKTKEKKDFVTTSIRICKSDYEKLRALSFHSGISINALMTKFIASSLEFLDVDPIKQ